VTAGLSRKTPDSRSLSLREVFESERVEHHSFELASAARQ
jgi:hypothetical protein